MLYYLYRHAAVLHSNVKRKRPFLNGRRKPNQTSPINSLRTRAEQAQYRHHFMACDFIDFLYLIRGVASSDALLPLLVALM